MFCVTILGLFRGYPHRPIRSMFGSNSLTPLTLTRHPRTLKTTTLGPVPLLPMDNLPSSTVLLWDLPGIPSFLGEPQIPHNAPSSILSASIFYPITFPSPDPLPPAVPLELSSFRYARSTCRCFWDHVWPGRESYRFLCIIRHLSGNQRL